MCVCVCVCVLHIRRIGVGPVLKVQEERDKGLGFKEEGKVTCRFRKNLTSASIT